MSGTADVQVRLAELRAAYVAGLPELLMRFQAAVERADREELRDIAHRLAGTGALYGIDELSTWGRKTERVARDGSSDEVRAAERQLAFIVAALR
jgi:hypothetical protein